MTLVTWFLGGNPFGVQSSAAPVATAGNPFMSAPPAAVGGGGGGFAQFGQQQQSNTVSTASVPHPGAQFPMQNGGFGAPAPPQAPGAWGAFGAAPGPPTGAPPAYPGTAGGIPLSQAQGLGYGAQLGGKPVMAGAGFAQPAPQQQQFGGWPAQPPPAAGGNPFMVSFSFLGRARL